MVRAKEELAQLIGRSMTRHLRRATFWTRNPPGVRVADLADAIAVDVLEGMARRQVSDGG